VNFAASQEIPLFMEPESPSPYPQVPATCPYSEPTPSSPHDLHQLPEDITFQVPSNMSLFRLRLRDTFSRNTPPPSPEIRVGE
jgi:hypothetical protein